MWQDTRSVYKNEFYFCIQAMKDMKVRLRKQSHLNIAAKKKCMGISLMKEA